MVRSQLRQLPRPFMVLWSGQLVSNLGTQVSLYALGLWLFQQQGRLSAFAAVAVAVQLAKLSALPLMSRHLLRWPPRRVMLASNGLGSLCTLSLAFTLLWIPAAWPPVFLCIGVAAAAEAVLVVTWSSQMASFVSKEQLGTASGLFAGSDGAIVMAAPLLGAVLAASAGLPGVLLTDCLSSLVAAACTLSVAWPLHPMEDPSDRSTALKEHPSLIWGGFRRALEVLWQQPSWRHLLLINTVVAGVLAAVEIAFPAWVVAASGSGRLTAALAFAGCGYGIGLWIWARVPPLSWLTVLRSALLFQGVLLTGAGLMCFQDWLGLWFAAVALFATGVPIALGGLQSLWLWSVPQVLQPRLFAGRYALEWGARLGALLGVSLLTDAVISPLLGGGDWPGWMLDALGRGPGRPAALAIGLLGWCLLIPLWLLWRPLGRLAVDKNQQ
ncbi:MAG: MFS transporter [Cyanobacteriota bacterium]|nr:MFS transporter [Cyanobacteriota bacterium]